MRKRVRKALCWVMSLLLCWELVPASALAYPQPQVVEGTYAYETVESGGSSRSEPFTFREDCFMRSSFLGCTHLPDLSAQAVLASRVWFGESGDPYGDAVDDMDRNVKNALTAMGFSDVEGNQYYHSDSLPDSAGVVVGHRALLVGNKEYTLLVICNRGDGYKREWLGSFTVGSGNMCQGFKDARDEVLRFVKNYVTAHGITGNVKVWTTGHSRGGTIASMVGGFFAGGGAAYLGKGISIAPEDVYCYAFASASSVKTGTPKAEELSVSAARGGAYEGRDTPGDAYVSTAEGVLDPQDASVYGGIRNYVRKDDIVSMLPPSSWGFERYGEDCLVGGGIAKVEDVLNELASISGSAYDLYANGGDPERYEPVVLDVLNLDLNNLDVKSLPFVSAGETGDQGLVQFLLRRVEGLGKDAPTNADFVSRGNEDAIKAALGTYLLTNDKVIDGGFAGVYEQGPKSSLIKAAVFGYLSYASEELMAQGRAANEAEATSIVLNDLLSYANDSPVEIKTAEELLVFLGQFFTAHEDTPLAQSLFDTIANAIPDNYVDIVIALPQAWGHSNYDLASGQSEDQADLVQSQSEEQIVVVDEDDQGTLDDSLQITETREEQAAQIAEVLGATIDNLLNGQGDSDASLAAQDGEDAQKRQKLRQAVVTILKDLASETYGGTERMLLYLALPALLKVSVYVSAGTSLTDLLQGLLPLAMKKSDTEEFASFVEAYNTLFAESIQEVKPIFIEGAKNAYNDSYADELGGYLDMLATHPIQTRNVLLNMLYGLDGYDTAYGIAAISTLVKNINIIPSMHVAWHFAAWMRAERKAANEGAHAVYQPVSVSVASKAMGTASANVSEELPGTKVALTAKPKTGYTFAGWKVVSPAKLKITKNSFVMPESAVAVRADFKANAYNVVFKANGGKGSMKKQDFAYGTKKALAANAFTRNSYSFVGWNTKANGSGKAYKNKQSVKNLSSKNGASVTLYAQWKKETTTTATINASAYIQNKDWLLMGTKNGVLGTTGKSLRLEALRLSASSSIAGGVEYRSHLQGSGWEKAWVRDGATSGTVDEGRRLEAVQIRLYGKMKKEFDVYYRVHSRRYGWMAWAKNGEKAGTQGMSRRAEAVQIALLKKGSKAPGKTYKGITQTYAKTFVKK